MLEEAGFAIFPPQSLVQLKRQAAWEKVTRNPNCSVASRGIFQVKPQNRMVAPPRIVQLCLGLQSSAFINGDLLVTWTMCKTQNGHLLSQLPFCPVCSFWEVAIFIHRIYILLFWEMMQYSCIGEQVSLGSFTGSSSYVSYYVKKNCNCQQNKQLAIQPNKASESLQ